MEQVVEAVVVLAVAVVEVIRELAQELKAILVGVRVMATTVDRVPDRRAKTVAAAVVRVV